MCVFFFFFWKWQEWDRSCEERVKEKDWDRESSSSETRKECHSNQHQAGNGPKNWLLLLGIEIFYLNLACMVRAAILCISDSTIFLVTFWTTVKQITTTKTHIFWIWICTIIFCIILFLSLCVCAYFYCWIFLFCSSSLSHTHTHNFRIVVVVVVIAFVVFRYF